MQTTSKGRIWTLPPAATLHDAERGSVTRSTEVTNLPEANKFLTREYRKGWELAGS
jgi:hypothetical protein